MTANYLADLHPDDLRYWLYVEKACWRLAVASGLGDILKSVRPTPKKNICRNGSFFFGLCYLQPESTLEITVRLFQDKSWAKSRVPLSNLIDTIAHEMAHLKASHKERDSHGPKFFRAFGKMLVLQEKIKIRVDLLAAGVKVPA